MEIPSGHIGYHVPSFYNLLLQKKIMKRILLGILLLLVPMLAAAFQPLQVDQAFSMSIQPQSKQTFLATWNIAPGYHLYRDRFAFNVLSPHSVRVASVALPQGIPKQDDILGKYVIYVGKVTIPVTLENPDANQVTLSIDYQGCADTGFCYPPVTKRLVLDLSKLPSATPKVIGESIKTSLAHASYSAQDKITQLLAQSNLFLVLLAFFGFGLLLAFTPCVLPMIPILSGIIVGQGEDITMLRAFWLSLTYVLAMAVTYAGAGVVAGLAGSYVQSILQSPIVIGIFSAMFVLLALSLFGFYELRMPNFLHHHVTQMSNKASSGTYVGVAIMGCLSTLIVSPCVSAPLIGALSYIGKTGNALLGGTALFTLGLGMGLPLLVIGTVGGKFLPRAGQWMHTVKDFFGVLMIAVAILLLSRIISAEFTMLLWAGLLIICAVYMGAFTNNPSTGFAKLWKGVSLILLVYGFILLIGAAMGNTDALQPLAFKQAIPVASVQSSGPFTTVKSIDDLKAAVARASAEHKPVILDFYADWCVSCQELDRSTFKDVQTQSGMSQFVLLRANVTANDDTDKALEKQYNVIAPPTILFFDANGNELTSARIVGAVDAKGFAEHMQEVLNQIKNN